jgi:hypothetical protein
METRRSACRSDGNFRSPRFPLSTGPPPRFPWITEANFPPPRAGDCVQTRALRETPFVGCVSGLLRNSWCPCGFPPAPTSRMAGDRRAVCAVASSSHSTPRPLRGTRLFTQRPRAAVLRSGSHFRFIWSSSGSLGLRRGSLGFLGLSGTAPAAERRHSGSPAC